MPVCPQCGSRHSIIIGINSNRYGHQPGGDECRRELAEAKLTTARAEASQATEALQVMGLELRAAQKRVEELEAELATARREKELAQRTGRLVHRDYEQHNGCMPYVAFEAVVRMKMDAEAKAGLAAAAAQEDSAEELSPEEQSTWAYIQKLVDDNPEAFTEHRQRAIAEVLAHGLQACRDLHEARKVSAEALRQVYGADAAQESDK